MKDAIKLIKTCRNLGVSEITYKDLKVSFFEPGPGPAKVKVKKQNSTETVEDLPQLSNQEIIEEEMARLLIEDPLAREQLLEKSLLQGV